MENYLNLPVKSRKYESIKFMIQLSESLLGIINYVDIMIVNVDAYYGDGECHIWRKTSSGGYAYAATDIRFVNEAVIKCIDVILKHKNVK